MRLLRYLAIAALCLFPSLAKAQSPVSLCVTAFNVNTGAFSCIPVGQTSPNIATINPLPVGGVANAAAPTFVEGLPAYFSFDLSGNVRVAGTFTPSATSANFTPVAPATATATKGTLLGIQYDSTQKTLTDGQQAAVSASARGAIFVATGADAFTVTGAGGTFPITAASGAIASGAISSGAFASGSVASGAFASGSLASGAMVDLVAQSAPVAPATATATKSSLGGCQATTAAVNPTTGQQAACSTDTNNNLLVSSGGAPNIATAQVSVTTGNITVAAARALRRSVKITNVTGTSAIYCGNTGVATTTGDYLGATAGSNLVFNTTAAVFCTVASVTQTVSVVETF